MSDKRRVGSVIRSKRLSGMIASKDMADALEISASYLSLIEAGKRKMPMDLRDKAFNLLGIKAEAPTPQEKALAARKRIKSRIAELFISVKAGNRDAIAKIEKIEKILGEKL